MYLDKTYQYLLISLLIIITPSNVSARDLLLQTVNSSENQGIRNLPNTPVLRVEGRYFLDQSNRVVMLRGVNLSGGAKVPPFSITNSLNDLDTLSQFGFNVIRLVVIWEAIEARPGIYNEAYLATLRELVEAAWMRGLFVIIDIHQDGFSRYTARGAGDGFPKWATSRRAKLSTPDNGQASKNWPLLMATDPAVYQSFADFYRNQNGVRTAYLRFLSLLASQFRNVPGVIGYDLLNEPWGNERKELAPLYCDAAEAIRSQHPSAILFIEGHISTNAGFQTKLPRPIFSNFAYAPHFYDPFVIALNAWHGRTRRINHGFMNMKTTADSWNVPLFVGEFGAPANARRVDDYIETIYERLDSNLASGAHWNYSPSWTFAEKDGWNHEDFNIINQEGESRPNYQVRPFPRATAGTPLEFCYQNSKEPGSWRTLSFTWFNDPNRGSTEIFLPEKVFPVACTCYQSNLQGLSLKRDLPSQSLICSSATAQLITLRVNSKTEP